MVCGVVVGKRNDGLWALQVEVLNPAFDYIPPELVELLITDVQGAQPSYVYR